MLALPLFVFCSVVAALDLIARRVPNRLLIVTALVQCCLIALGRSQVGASEAALGALLGLFGLMPFYALRLMGAGDVKFGAVLGLFCGPWPLFITWLFGSVLAGFHALVFYTINANPGLQILSLRYTQSGFQRRLDTYRQGRRGIPYAAYLAIAACITKLYAVT